MEGSRLLVYWMLVRRGAPADENCEGGLHLSAGVPGIH
jgi:hypothetical protein